MKEYLFLIKNIPDHTAGFDKEKMNKFLKSCETYIERLKKSGNLKNAQPFGYGAISLSKNGPHWNQAKVEEHDYVIAGYYHIVAKDIGDALSIAKENPEFEFTDHAKIEIRELKSEEPETGYVYPS
jgi:hypothetical protein